MDPDTRGSGGLRMLFRSPTSEPGRFFAKDPCVIRYKGRGYLYFSKQLIEENGYDRFVIGIAVSENLEDWEEAGVILPEQEAEGRGLAAPGAIVLDGVIHLFYQSYGQFPKDHICHATSVDGIHFERDETNPVVVPEGDWNAHRAIDADVIAFGNELFMYWATRDPDLKIQMLGVSSARLGSGYHRNDWVQRCCESILKPELPWERTCIEAPASLVRDGRVYLFYAGAYNCSPQQIGCAVSDDAIHFERLRETPLLSNGPADAWNASESGHPYVFEDENGTIHLFYQGSPDGGKNWLLSRAEVVFDEQGIPEIHPGVILLDTKSSE